MLKSIVEPVSEYYPIPWWVWTGNMKKTEMLRQLNLMKEQDIREFFIFAHAGLEYPVFLEDSWWDYVDFTIGECEKLGMKVWIYDDLSWPSGTAGGLAMQLHPEYRMQLLQCRRHPVAAGEVYRQDPALDMVHIEFCSDSGEIFPITLDESWQWRNDLGVGGKVTLIINTVYDEIQLSSTAVAWTRHQRGSADLLDPDAVDAWMDCIYGEYERRFSRHFGKTVKGFFCDEPRPNRCDGHSIPWTGKLFEMFQKKFGYDLIPHLPEIFFDQGKFIETRRDYWTLITGLFADNFICRLRKWCDKNGLLLTGHTAPEEMCYQRNMLISNGDIPQIIRHMSIPGCDLLGAQTPYFSDPGAPWYGVGLEAMQNLILTVKRPASTARYAGADRAMCEAFGVRSWHGDMREQKLINDYLAACGINFINDNTLSYTVSDYRSNSAGKHFTQPWWKYYHLFTNYSAGLSAFAAWGVIDAQTAILFPLTTQQSMTPADIQSEIPFEGDLKNAVNNCGRVLLKNHIPFEYIWEYVIKDAVVTDGGLEIPGGTVRVLILPQSYIIGEKVFEKLQKFIGVGGKVIAVGSAPEYILPENGEKYAVPGESGFTVIHDFGNNRFDRQLLDSVYGHIPPQWTLEGEDTEKVVSCMRRNGNIRMLFLANQLPGNRKVTFFHKFGSNIRLLDMEKGKCFALSQRQSGNRLAADIELAENQSVILVINVPEELPEEVIEYSSNNSVQIRLSDNWDFTAEPANHYLPPCSLRLDPLDIGEKEKWFASSPEKDNVSAKLWRRIAAGKAPFGLSPEESKTYWISGTFDLENVPDDLTLIVDNQDCLAAYVNGNRLDDPLPAALWDQENRSYPCAAYAHCGKNRFFLKIRTSDWFSPSRGVTGYYEFKVADKYPMRVVLSGSFAVCKDKLIALPQQLCSKKAWNSQGFPFFAGTGCYRQKFTLTAVPRRARLRLTALNGVAAITVNGCDVGVRAWQPWEFDLQNALKQGENEIVIKISGSLGNILPRSYGDRWSPPADYGLTGGAIIDIEQ